MHAFCASRKIAVIALALMLSAGITQKADGFEKHIVAGEVTDAVGTGIYMALVTATNNDTGEVMDLYTDMNGAYSFDVSNYPSGFSNGDELFITVEHGGYSSSGVVLIDVSVPAQFLDMELDMTTHLISGTVHGVEDDDSMFRPVLVTNTENGENVYDFTNATSQYLLDVGLFSTPPSPGDVFSFSVDYDGFHGFNSTFIDTGTHQNVDIWVSDIEPPAIVVNAPDVVDVGDGIMVLANITDNYRLTLADLYYKEIGQAFFTQIALKEDDGGVYDWNGNQAADPGLFGHVIPGQSIPGIVEYYIVASDGNNTETTATANVTVEDVTAPVILHTPITTLEAGDTVEIVSAVTDNVAVDEVLLYLKGVGEAAFSPIAMLPTGEPDEYGATIPAQFETGPVRYYIWANDSSSNTAQTQAYWFNVTDTTPPDIDHVPVNSARVWTAINITAVITDIVNLTDVDIEVEDVLGGLSNQSMKNWGGDKFSFDIPGQPAPGILNYTIWARDGSANSISFGQSVLITDNSTPVITHAPASDSEVFNNITITANVVDDVGVIGVWLFYKNESDAGYTTLNMTDDGTGGDETAGDGNWTAIIPPPGNLETISYYINASDGANNQSHPALAPCHNITIYDTQAPTLANIMVNGPYVVNEPVPVSVNITDNYMVDEVWLHYRDVGNLSWKHMQMTSSDASTATRRNGTYNASIPAQATPGNLTWYFTANDTSNNTVSSPSLNPKTSPYTMEIGDGAIPELFHTRPVTEAGVNSTLELDVTVTHPFGIADIYLFGQHNLAQLLIRPDSVNNDTYQFTLDRLNRSGLFTYRFVATDAEGNSNQTIDYLINITNELPVISHTPVASHSFEEALTISAIVTDDLAVGGVTLNWKESYEQGFTTVDMVRMSSFPPVYSAVLEFSEPGIVYYNITANDAEGRSISPAGSTAMAGEYHETALLDEDAPVIVHQALSDFNTSTLPIFRATVTDNWRVESVTLHYLNESMTSYAQVELAPVSGQPGNYSNVLGYQPAGNFSYSIMASDGRFNVTTGVYRVEVTEDTPPVNSGGMLLWALIILMAVAITIIIFGLKYFGPKKYGSTSKTEKVSDDSPSDTDNGSAEGPGENE